MKPISLNIPSKTFILGEYAVLAKQPALLVATQPYCQINLRPTSKPHNPFHPKSPAGMWIENHLTDVPIDFDINIPPSMASMGLGVSSAEWISAYLGQYFYKKHPFSLWDVEFRRKCLQAYRAQQDSLTHPGSGADWMCQMIGSYTYYHPKDLSIQSTDWPFEEEYSWLIISTHQKHATHEHLNELKNIESFASWGHILEQAWIHWQNKDAQGFISQVQAYQAQLEQSHLVAPHTQQLLEAIGHIKGVECAKGCGAMGADTIWMMTKKTDITSIKQTLTQLSIDIIADHTKVSEGLQWKPL